MHYYTRHVGDYLKATAHLTMIEDGAYTRLIDRYIDLEGALPLDIKDCCRLVRANTRQEREAVARVLAEFFAKTEHGYWHGGCEAQIAHCTDKSTKASASARIRWGNRRQAPDLKATATAPGMDMRTQVHPHSEGNADALLPITQYPIPRTQYPGPNIRSPSAHAFGVLGSPPPASPAPVHAVGDGTNETDWQRQRRLAAEARRIAAALEKAGVPGVCATNHHLRGLVAAGVDELDFLAVVPAAKGKEHPFAYLLATVNGRRKDAARDAGAMRDRLAAAAPSASQ